MAAKVCVVVPIDTLPGFRGGRLSAYNSFNVLYVVYINFSGQCIVNISVYIYVTFVAAEVVLCALCCCCCCALEHAQNGLDAKHTFCVS